MSTADNESVPGTEPVTEAAESSAVNESETGIPDAELANTLLLCTYCCIGKALPALAIKNPQNYTQVAVANLFPQEQLVILTD